MYMKKVNNQISKPFLELGFSLMFYKGFLSMSNGCDVIYEIGDFSFNKLNHHPWQIFQKFIPSQARKTTYVLDSLYFLSKTKFTSVIVISNTASPNLAPWCMVIGRLQFVHICNLLSTSMVKSCISLIRRLHAGCPHM